MREMERIRTKLAVTMFGFTNLQVNLKLGVRSLKFYENNYYLNFYES